MSRTAIAGRAIAGLAVAGVGDEGEDGGGGGNAHGQHGHYSLRQPARKLKRREPIVVLPPVVIAKPVAKPYELPEPDFEYEALAYAEAYRAALLNAVRHRQQQEDEALALLLLSH